MQQIIHMEFGSTVYGTSLPTSDKDYKGIFLPHPRDILLGRVKETVSTTTKPANQVKNDETVIDTESFSLKQYFKLLLEGQTVALSMFFMPERHISHGLIYMREIRELKPYVLHKGVSAFAGYCRQQANKYGIKGSRVAAIRGICEILEKLIVEVGHKTKLKDVWPHIQVWVWKNPEHAQIVEVIHKGQDRTELMLEVCNRKAQAAITLDNAYNIYAKQMKEYGQRALLAEAQEGVDWKACMHAVRVSKEAEELLLDHTITYPRPEAELLLKIRKGELPYKQVAELIEQGLDNLEIAQAKSTLPDKPSYTLIDEYIYDEYFVHIRDY